MAEEACVQRVRRTVSAILECTENLVAHGNFEGLIAGVQMLAVGEREACLRNIVSGLEYVHVQGHGGRIYSWVVFFFSKSLEAEHRRIQFDMPGVDYDANIVCIQEYRIQKDKLNEVLDAASRQFLFIDSIENQVLWAWSEFNGYAS